MKEIIIVDKEDRLLVTIDSDSDDQAVANDSVEILDFTDERLVVRLKNDYEVEWKWDIKVNL